MNTKSKQGDDLDTAQHILMGGCPYCSVMSDISVWLHEESCPIRIEFWKNVTSPLPVDELHKLHEISKSS